MVGCVAPTILFVYVKKVMKMPVSGTHSIVGAVVGFALIAKGPN